MRRRLLATNVPRVCARVVCARRATGVCSSMRRKVEETTCCRKPLVSLRLATPMPARPALRTEAICSEAIGEVPLRPLAHMLLLPRLGLILRLKHLHLWYYHFSSPPPLSFLKQNECSRSRHWGMDSSLPHHSSLITHHSEMPEGDAIKCRWW